MKSCIKAVLTQGIITNPIKRRLQTLLKNAENDDETFGKFQKILKDVPHSYLYTVNANDKNIMFPDVEVDVVETMGNVTMKLPPIMYGDPRNAEHIKRMRTAITIARRAKKQLIVDLRKCGGGDLNVFIDGFIDAFNGDATLLSVEGQKFYLCWCIAKRKIVKRGCKMRPYKLSDDLEIVCKVGPRTASSGEILAAILREAGARIVGLQTAGLLSVSQYKKFGKYIVGFPTAYISTPSYTYFTRQYLSPKNLK